VSRIWHLLMSCLKYEKYFVHNIFLPQRIYLKSVEVSFPAHPSLLIGSPGAFPHTLK